jgi:hypothetical protein
MLERQVISQLLPHWISTVFQLQNHPQKLAHHGLPPTQPAFDLSLDKRLINFAGISVESDDSIHCVFVLDDHAIQFHVIRFPYQQEPTLLAEQRIEFHSRMSYIAMKSGLMVHDWMNFQAIRVEPEAISSKPHFIETPMAVNFGSHLILCPSFSSISIDGTVMYSSMSRISAITANVVFHVLVFGTFDGYISIVSLHRWKIVRKMSLEGQIARQILITNALGLILVRTFERIFVFNVNGMPVTAVAINFEIVRWTAFVSAQGFDYVVYSNADSEVGWFEAFAPEQKHTLFLFRDLVLLTYVKAIQAVVVVSAAGLVKCSRLSPDP